MAGDPIAIQHPPAIKVAGRRLSLSGRHARSTHNTTSSARRNAAGHNSPIPDYPRPAPPGEEHPDPLHTGPEEEVPKKEKKHNMHDNEKKIRESPFWKAGMTQPTRDTGAGKMGLAGFGAGGRIGQPAGKGFGA
ncbi:hypothetical protein APHAL10511_005055 [Amanita phalloides]|nr:hypothetical protein APHAL10511_005055 [Amanita phalloides]